MAEEAKPGFADSVFNSVAGGIEYIIQPKKDTFWHTLNSKWLNLHAWVAYVGDYGISRGLFLVILFIPLFFTAGGLLPQFYDLAFGWLLFAFPVIGPAAGVIGFATLWIWYVQSAFHFYKFDPVLIEMKIPTEISKSPRAMEQVFSNLWVMKNETTQFDRWWKGGQRPYFSFELVSLGGDVRFFIYTRREYKNVVEANLYAQYPEVEVVEAEDYAQKFVFDDTADCFVTDFELKTNMSGMSVDPLEPEKSPVNAYPPKSYIDFELDKDPKEEYRVDPYASVLEVFSAMQPGEQLWMQIVIRQHSTQVWKDVVEKEVEKVRIASTKLVDEENGTGFPRPTWKQNEQIRTMERHLSKLPFEVGMRGIYCAPRGKMRGSENAAMRYIWRPYANMNWMSMWRPVRGHNIFDWPWQDWNQVRERLFTRRFLDAYRRRCFFGYPWRTPFNIVSTETLATMWHPPSSTAATPGLQRIPTSKAAAPANLPI